MTPEDILTVPGARVSVRIEEKTRLGDYHDTLHFTPAEWAALTQPQITAAIAGRVNNWIAFVEQQSSLPPVVPTKAELLERETQLVEQVEVLTDTIIGRVAEFSKGELQNIHGKIKAKLDKLDREIAKK